MATTTYGNTFGAQLMGRLSDAMDTLRTKYAQNRVYRETYTELNALSGRELADLGMSRAMIRSVAYEAAYGK